MKNSKFYLFIHVEKVAGSSINSILINKLKFYFSLKNWNVWSNSTEAEFSPKELSLLTMILPFINGLGGHSLRGYYTYKVERRDVKTIAFFRDPIDRYVSHYRHQKYKMGIDWTFESFLKEKRFSNYTTYRFSKGGCLEEAKWNIGKLDFIGLQERFQDSLEMLSVFLDKGSLENVFINLNNNSKGEHFEIKSNLNYLESIKSNNEKDIELYNFVKYELYPAQKKKYMASNISLGKLNKSNKFWEQNNNEFRKIILRPIEFIVKMTIKYVRN